MKVDVEKLLNDLGIRNVRRSGNEVSFSCPFSEHAHGDQTPSARMNAESNVWFCHGCKRRGNASTFLAEAEGISVMEAISRLQAEERLPYVPPAEQFVDHLRELLERPQFEEPIDPGEIDGFAPYPDWVAPNWGTVDRASPEGYLLRRGFMRRTLSAIGVLWDTRRRRVVLPVEQDGVLVGAKGRAVDEVTEPKYLVYAPYYSPAHTLFLADLAKMNSQWSRLIVCEGELDAMKLYEYGWRAVALGGSYMSDWHEIAIASLSGVNHVTIFFDDDRAGREGADLAVSRLTKWFSAITVVGPHDGDACSMSQDECARAILDAENLVTRKVK